MEMFVTERFQRRYRRQVWPHAYTQQAAWEMLQHQRQHPDVWLRGYKALEGFESKVFRDRLPGAHRLLFACVDGGVLLLDVGPRAEIYKTYSRAKLRQDLSGRRIPAPASLTERPTVVLFTDATDRQISRLPHEDEPAWATYLDDGQYDTVLRILLDTIDLDPPRGQRRSWLITGGPGTGKTVVLFKILMEALNEGMSVRLDASDAVVRYHEAALSTVGFNCDLSSVRGSADDPVQSGLLKDQKAVDLLLVDDPTSLKTISSAVRWADASRARAVIVAVDPLQLEDTVTDVQWQDLTSRRHVEEVQLRRCYRQKLVLGQASVRAMRVIGSSSPFARADKKQEELEGRKRITAAFNDLEFINRGGHERVFAPASLADVEETVSEVRAALPAAWTHWPGLLVAVDDDLGPLPGSIQKLLSGIPHEVFRLEQNPDLDWTCAVPGVTRVKGTEYLHVMLFVSASLKRELSDQFQSKGKKVYARRRLLRIPISRARDSLTTFVWPRRFSSKAWPTLTTDDGAAAADAYLAAASAITTWSTTRTNPMV